MAESVANELVLQSMEHQGESSKSKLKDSKTAKAGRSVHEEKKTEKSVEDKKSRPQKIMQFQTIKISQVLSLGLTHLSKQKVLRVLINLYMVIFWF